MRIVRQLLTESILLQLSRSGRTSARRLGADLLVAMAPRMFRAWLRWSESSSLRMDAWSFDRDRVLFGLAPALGASQPDINESLKESGRSTEAAVQPDAQPSSSFRNRSCSGAVDRAGLMTRSFVSLMRVSPGFEPKNLLTLNVSLPQQKYRENKQINSFFDQLFARVRSVPGVVEIGGVDPLPLSNSNATTGFIVEGGPSLTLADRPEVGERTVTPEYFHAMRIPLLKGRTFTERDREDTPRVVIVNESLARRFWPGDEAPGKRLGFRSTEPQVWHEIVGIVGDVKHERLDADPKPELFFRTSSIRVGL